MVSHSLQDLLTLPLLTIPSHSCVLLLPQLRDVPSFHWAFVCAILPPYQLMAIVYRYVEEVGGGVMCMFKFLCFLWSVISERKPTHLITHGYLLGGERFRGLRSWGSFD